MHLFIEEDVYIIKQAYKTNKNELLHSYIKMRYSMSKSDIYETTLYYVSLLSIVVNLFYLYIGFPAEIEYMLMRWGVSFGLVFLLILLQVLTVREKRKLNQYEKEFTQEKLTEMANILIDQFANNEELLERVLIFFINEINKGDF